MKKPFLLLAIACSCASFGQISADEAIIEPALANLRDDTEVIYRLQGSETLGSTTNTFFTAALWKREPTTAGDLLKIRVREIRNDVERRWLIGDGRHIWGVDPTARTYSATLYGGYGSALPTTYRQNFLQSLNVLSSGQSAYLARLIKEVHGGTNADYRTWMPGGGAGYTIEIADSDGEIANDYARDIPYTATQNVHYVVYSFRPASTANRRSMAFELSRSSDVAPWLPTKVTYYDYTNPRGVDRLTFWELMIDPVAVVSDEELTFVPPAGYRSIAAPAGRAASSSGGG